LKRLGLLLVAALIASLAQGGVDFDAGADERVREELMQNVPGLPNGGVLLPKERSGFVNHMRFRTRVWGDLKLDTENAGKFRIFTRFTDECRWYVEPKKTAYTFPAEVTVDNLFLEGKDLFDGVMDFLVGRRDLYELYGLDHVFVDGTPGDGSRTTYGDIVQLGFNVTDEERLDLFFLHNCDRNHLRWGTDRSDVTSMSGFGGDTDREMDDWGAGAIWSGKAYERALDYNVFAMDKTTQGFRRNGISHPWTSRAMGGFKLVPHLNEEWSLQFEGMSQVGQNEDNDLLTGWSAYSGVNWKSATSSQYKPFGKLGYHFMSGDDDAGEEDGGHSAWDPMWARGVNDSEGFLYGTHYGQAWWSNMHYFKLTGGLELNGPKHRIEANTGPIFAAAQDGMGGDDGSFKGLLSQARYVFPLWLADKSKGERFEVVGHILGEWFNPGDYYASDRPMYFFRWQLEFKF